MTIKNLKVADNRFLTFDVHGTYDQTWKIKAQVEVRIGVTKWGKDMVYVDAYECNGRPYDEQRGRDVKAIKALSEDLQQMADDNNWILWSY